MKKSRKQRSRKQRSHKQPSHKQPSHKQRSRKRSRKQRSRKQRSRKYKNDSEEEDQERSWSDDFYNLPLWLQKQIINNSWYSLFYMTGQIDDLLQGDFTVPPW